MDGTEAEERRKDGSVVVSYMPSINEVTHLLQTGATDTTEISQVMSLLYFTVELFTYGSLKALEQCIDGCSKIYNVMSTALLQSLENKSVA